MKKETLHLEKNTIQHLNLVAETLDDEALENLRGGQDDQRRATIVPVICE
ncbi:MAG: hypothetical protein KAW12_05845 [Candidatus Aminicenantes bacterium]|nr:hypothetical protein [Candidatus Aminicenantes bacterium]